MTGWVRARLVSESKRPGPAGRERKRLKDGPARIALKALARALFFADLRGTRAIRRLRGEKPYRLGGACGLCAACCESPMIQTGVWTYRLRTLRFLFLAWHRIVNGFHLVGEHPRLNAFSFRCTHFDPATRRCDSYSSRPGMCRDYPRALLWEGEPPFLAGCGYRAISPNAERVRRLLEDEGLPPEKLDEIEERLHLRE